MNSFEEDFSKSLNATPLTSEQKNVIRARYIALVLATRDEYIWVSVAYYALTSIITISGVLIASLTPLEQWFGQAGSTAVFWIVWSLAILLTISNKTLYLLNIGKKYILGLALLEKLMSEGWSFIAGIGIYNIEAFDERFMLFCARIETIKLKSMESIPEMNDASMGILSTAALTHHKSDINSSPLGSRYSNNLKAVAGENSHRSVNTIPNILSGSREDTHVTDVIVTDDHSESN